MKKVWNRLWGQWQVDDKNGRVVAESNEKTAYVNTYDDWYIVFWKKFLDKL